MRKFQPCHADSFRSVNLANLHAAVGAPNQEFVTVASWNIMKTPIDETKRVFRFPPKNSYEDSNAICPAKKASKDDFRYKSDAYQSLFSKFHQRMVDSQTLRHPDWRYLHASNHQAILPTSGFEVIDQTELSDLELDKLVGVITAGYALVYGRYDGYEGASLSYNPEYQTIQSDTVWDHSRHFCLTAPLESDESQKRISELVRDWFNRVNSSHPWVINKVTNRPSDESWTLAICECLDSFKEFYIKPSQSSARGSKVYRVLIAESESKYALTVGCPTEDETEKSVVERILNVDSCDDNEITVQNLSKTELINAIVALSKTIAYPIIEEVIPMTLSYGKRVEFRVAQIIDQSQPNNVIQRCYCKSSTNWTAANISLGGEAASAAESIKALIDEHVKNPGEKLELNILEALFSAAREFNSAYLEYLKKLTKLLPESIKPYELREKKVPSAIDIGLQLNEDGSFKLFLIEAAFSAKLSGLQNEDPTFVEMFEQLVQRFDGMYSPSYGY